VLADTSVAVAAIIGTHDFHPVAMAAVKEHQPGLAGHALYETYSVLTRYPDIRIAPAHAIAAIDRMFPFHAVLSADAGRKMLTELAGAGHGGGTVYDALVAAAAVEAGMPLLTFDRRARGTYTTVGAAVRYLG
jgi:predicted nucleic acid-binding protein